MSYQVLARKWRPSTFEEVVGQAHVTRTLANAVKSGRVGHAYLFSGPRGVGKTTTARLLAKALNCPNAKDAISCNNCDVCREITAGVSLDVIEIDAASNRGIDEIRNLRENVKYAPAGGKYKIYVVDEVHMLTDAAFNALLKTLEEPPPHVKFILATTAPLKVPETILSRCQRFEFVRIPTREVFTRLKHICSTEGFHVKDEVLMLLSRRANGSLRDAESMLDQLISAGLEAAGEPEVAQLLGLSGADTFFSVIDAVKAKDARKALEALASIFDRGANLDEFTDGLMEHLRNLLLIKIHPDLASLVEASSGNLKRYEEQAKQFTEGDILRMINIASRASYAVRRSALPRLHLEMAVVEMSYLDSTTKLSELIEKLDAIEADLSHAQIDTRPGMDRALHKTAAPAPSSHTDDPPQTPVVPAASSRSDKPTQTPVVPAPSSHTDEPPQTPVVPAPSSHTDEPTQTKDEPAPAAQVDDAQAVRTGVAQSAETGDVQKSVAQIIHVTPEYRQKWNEVVEKINSRKKTLWACISGAYFRGISQGKVILGFEDGKSFEQSRVEDKVNKKILQEELAAAFKTNLGVSCIRIEPGREEASEQSAPDEIGNGTQSEPDELSTGTQCVPEEARNNTKKPATDDSLKDDSLKNILECFDGEVIED